MALLLRELVLLLLLSASPLAASVLVAEGGEECIRIEPVYKYVGTGGLVVINGAISPPMKAKILVVFEKPNNQTVEVEVESFENGTFAASAFADVGGVWRINASYLGDELRGPCSSNTAYVEVIAPVVPLWLRLLVVTLIIIGIMGWASSRR
ncbi:MAG: hypothetical protein QXU97_04515 [Fervidicoccaceae archaeon]